MTDYQVSCLLNDVADAFEYEVPEEGYNNGHYMAACAYESKGIDGLRALCEEYGIDYDDWVR